MASQTTFAFIITFISCFFKFFLEIYSFFTLISTFIASVNNTFLLYNLYCTVLSHGNFVCFLPTNLSIGFAYSPVKVSDNPLKLFFLYPRAGFSRFCNEDRKEIGDIDIDCVESDRPAIFRHIVDRFGDDKTARVAAYGTIQAKGVVDDVCRHLAMKWAKDHPNEDKNDNPYSLKVADRIKKELDGDEEKERNRYRDVFYYFDGLINTRVSQSIHPAGMVISPITLNDHYGVFDKDGESCLMMDMDEAHEVGVAKYDFLVLKTVQVIRDTCRYLGRPYPKSHEIDWND